MEDEKKILRLKEAFRVLQSKGACDSQYQAADVLGYTASSFSQILNGKVPISEKFLRRLKTLDKSLDLELNLDYIRTGEGEVLTARHTAIAKEININNGNDTFFHSHDISVSGGGGSQTTGALKMQVQYLEKLIAEKDVTIKEKDATIKEKERLITLLMGKLEK